MKSRCVHVESGHILNAPPADGASLVRMKRGAPDGGRCKRPSSGSFHSTSAPAPFFCLIANLSCSLPLPSHLAGCYADGTLVDTRTASWSQEVTIIISGDNWRKEEEEVMPTLMGSFIWESFICVNYSHNSIWHMAAYKVFNGKEDGGKIKIAK